MIHGRDQVRKVDQCLFDEGPVGVLDGAVHLGGGEARDVSSFGIRGGPQPRVRMPGSEGGMRLCAFCLCCCCMSGQGVVTARGVDILWSAAIAPTTSRSTRKRVLVATYSSNVWTSCVIVCSQCCLFAECDAPVQKPRHSSRAPSCSLLSVACLDSLLLDGRWAGHRPVTCVSLSLSPAFLSEL